VTGMPATERAYHTTPLLSNGRVLLARGYNSSSALSRAQLDDGGLGCSASWQPQIATFTSPLSSGGGLLRAEARWTLGIGSSQFLFLKSRRKVSLLCIGPASADIGACRTR